QCHAINFPFVMQGCHNPRNLRIWSCDQVESPTMAETCLSITVDASTIRSIPGCEHPTTRISPLGVSIASESSRSSKVPAVWDTVAITDIPVAAFVTPSIRTKLALVHGVPKVIVCGGFPL